MSKSSVKQIMSKSETVKTDELKVYPKNPRVGNVEEIAKSLVSNGQFQPLVVQRSTNYVLSGNHTYKAALSLGWKEIDVVWVEVDDTAAKKIVLAANRTNDLATYDTSILTEILASIPDAKGTGYDDDAVSALLAGMQDRDTEMIQNVVRPPVRVDFEGSGDDEDWDLDSNIKRTQERHDIRYGDEGTQSVAGSGSDVEAMRVAESIASLQIQFEQFQETLWPSSNYWGVPDLRPDMLLDELPEKLDTWGGQDATPDDGETTWIWNTGVAASKGLPWERAILSFFTYDTKFESWFDQPAFQVARLIHNGCTRAIVPDTSFWLDDTRFHHLSAAYNAQWMGRFMQECGIKVIPRLMWTDLESIKVGRLGIPKSPPIAAVCIQAIDKKEVASQMTPEGLRLMVKEIDPGTLIVYGGGTARDVVEKAHLPKDLKVVHVENYAAKRRGVVFDNPTGKAVVDKAARKKLREEKAAAKAAAQSAPAAEEEREEAPAEG